MKSTYSKFSQGSALIEAVVALAAVVIIVTAISIIVTLSVSNSTFIKNQNLANKYAQQGMEYIRGIKENDFSQFITYRGIAGNNYCLDFQNQLRLDCYDQVIPELGFKRNVSFKPGCGVNGSDTQVGVSVKWSSGKCPQDNTFCHKAEFISCFSDSAESKL